MPKVWKIADKVSDDLVKQLLHNRGVKTEQDKEKFFNPKLSDFEKDLNIAGIDQAVKRIKKAIASNELIVVHGDYDVDGICGSAILYLGLTSKGVKVLPYIPHREKEGYGLSKQGVDFAKDAGAKLLITVDCGIVSFEAVDYAKKVRLDVILTDHHQMAETAPSADVIIHSTKMCGTAVAWCLLRKIVSENTANELLDYVAIATVCDLMPLQGVNRCFVKLGLKQLKQTKRVGFLSLCNEAGISPNQTDTYHIGYVIGPRLNAIGRLEHALDGLRLLCTKDPVKAKRLARVLSDANDQRRQLTQDATSEARDMIISQKLHEQKIIILSSRKWLSGIIGLVAGRVCEEFNVASVAISEGEDISRGSARGVNGLNIVETLRSCSDVLINVGGHEGAAGFTIETSKIEIFKQRLRESLSKKEHQVSEPVLNIDAEVQIIKLNKDLYDKLQQFAPFGLGNPQPVLASTEVQINDLRTVGENKHLKFRVDNLDAIAFGMGDMAKTLLVCHERDRRIDLAYHLEIDNYNLSRAKISSYAYNGFEKLQLKVKDIRIR